MLRRERARGVRARRRAAQRRRRRHFWAAGAPPAARERGGMLRTRRRRIRRPSAAAARESGRRWRGRDGGACCVLRFVRGGAGRRGRASAVAAISGHAGERRRGEGEGDYEGCFTKKSIPFSLFTFRSLAARFRVLRVIFLCFRGAFLRTVTDASRGPSDRRPSARIALL